MPPSTSSKDKSNADNIRSSPNPGTAVRTNTRRNGNSIIIEDLQDIKDSLEGRKFLEKHSLLCPPGEPPSHSSLATCLHQISAMAGLQKPVINAIRSVAFLLDELEETQINETVRDAFDSQITEFTSDMKLLIEDAKEKIDAHIKTSEERITQLAAQVPAPQPSSQPSQPRPSTHTYASVLISPPAHANPRVAAREGIKARQFAIVGIKNSKFSHLDFTQLKTELNKILTDLEIPTGKLRSVASARNGSTIIEADNDEAASWLSRPENQQRICTEIGLEVEFRIRTYNVIAFNVPIAINPDDSSHREEICEANDLEVNTITAAKWAKAVERRSPNQRTAHLLLTLNDADAANRAITNGLYICNRRCHIEKSKREPTRCLKCQGWNHFAKDCVEEDDKCGNCAEHHRTTNCLSTARRCVSCRTDDHASWSRECPTFLKKMGEYNSRNPDNTMQFFPTADPWSWFTTDKPSIPTAYRPKARPSPPPPPPPPPPSTQARLSSNQLSKRPQQPRRQWDSYVPSYNFSAPFTIADQVDYSGWDNTPGPSNSRPANSHPGSSLSSQQPTRGGSSSNGGSSGNSGSGNGGNGNSGTPTVTNITTNTTNTNATNTSDVASPQFDRSRSPPSSNNA